jgi:hypothetical protein
MKENQHTPGPYGGRPYRLGGRLHIAITFTDDEGVIHDLATVSGRNAEANAALFIAAPKLLDALDWIVWEIEWGCADRDTILRVAKEAVKEATPIEQAKGAA